jgi:type II secretory ATPase GspE/PulE/Tfp pilus assembly ATPase PilB-like protein
MSTMHSGDSAEAIVRLLEMGIAPYQLVGALTLVCSQRLLRTVCSACDGKGDCEHCANTGYHGRAACGQLALMNETLRQAVLDHRPVGELRQAISSEWADLAADARRLMDAGRTTADEIRRVLGVTGAMPEPASRQPGQDNEREFTCRGLSTKV